MNLIKNALLYRASLPAPTDLAAHLAEKPFTPVLPSHAESAGFIPNPFTGQLVSEFPGGFAVRLRRDLKRISKKALGLALLESSEKLSKDAGRDLTREEVAELRERIHQDALKAALPERSEVDAFYHCESQTLLLATTSKDTASRLLFLLIEACGAVETSTIHVSDVKGGLTTRLTQYYQYNNRAAFDGFSLGDSVQLKGQGGQARFDLANLDDASQGLKEALAGCMSVARLSLCHADSLTFTLTQDFTLRSIDFHAPDDEDALDQIETGAELWQHHAAVQVILLAAAVNALRDLFSYPDSEADESRDEAALYDLASHYVSASRSACAASLQRHLRIGYNRTQRLLERLQEAGIVSPPDSDGQRHLLEVRA